MAADKYQHKYLNDKHLVLVSRHGDRKREGIDKSSTYDYVNPW